ncbi:727_t:CDS:1, partial [Scutellospora calospora]
MDNSNELDKSIIEPETVNLYVVKTFQNWELCEAFLCKWAKKQGFRIIKDRVYHEEDV